jgi:hypothetical protein
METYLESFNRLHNELDITPKNRAALKLSETPERFLLEKHGVKIIDIERPAYGLIDNMIINEKINLYEMRKQYRSLVYAYLYEMHTESTLAMISEVFNVIENTEKKIVDLDAVKDTNKKLANLDAIRKNYRKLTVLDDLDDVNDTNKNVPVLDAVNAHVMLREPRVNIPNMKSTKKAAPEASVEDTVVDVDADAAVAVAVATPVKKSQVKIGRIAKDILKQSLLTGKVSETDLKIFFFRTLKDCVARPSSKNNAISKDKLIDRMLENPNLKRLLPTAYKSKSKEDICKLLFPVK